jgi:hypothetical protein
MTVIGGFLTCLMMILVQIAAGNRGVLIFARIMIAMLSATFLVIYYSVKRTNSPYPSSIL